MKILLGTHQLEVLAGSELFTAELAHAFRAHGHDVAIFTFFKGELARAIETQGIPVFDPDGRSIVSRFTPDIVQTSHLPCAHLLRALVPDAIRVHAMLGVIPNLEAPPLDGDAFSLGLAISEEVADRIGRTPFGRDVEVAIFRNWFDDRAVAAADARQPCQPLRVAVVSNHIAPRLVEALSELEVAGNVRVGYFGAQRTSVPVDGTLLVQYDLIISIGRTVLLSAACGIPCIMADIHGSDGLLTADNLDLVRTVNFSGRLKRGEITKVHLQEEIGKLHSYDREELRRRITVEYSLKSRAEWLLSRYEALLASQLEDTQNRHRPPAFSPPCEGLVYSDLTVAVRQLRGQLEQAQNQIAALNEQTRNTTGVANPVEMLALARKFGLNLRITCSRWRRQLMGWRWQSNGHDAVRP